MATRLYFHAASNSLPGTFPAGEQSSVAANFTASGANTLRTMDTTVGVAQTNITGTTLAQTAQQIGFFGFFCSPPFDVDQTVGTNGQTITLNIANQESSSSANAWADLRFNLYIWRPSTGAVVGSIQDQGTLTGDAEPGAFNSERVNQGTRTGSTPIAALAGDVLICEVWERHTQATSIAYTCNFYFDGTTTNTTTNAVVSNHASFLDFGTDTLTFEAVPVNASFSNTFGSMSLIAAAIAGSEASFDNTFASVGLSASMETVFVASTSFTLDSIGLTADAQMSGTAVECTFSNVFDGVDLAGAAETVMSAALSSTFGGVGLTAAAVFDLDFSAAFSRTFASIALAADAFIVPPLPFIGTTTMNDSLDRWLTNRGFTGTLQDKQWQYLRSVVVGASDTDTLNDLWLKGGLQQGYGTEIQQIQLNWAINQGATSTLTWEDAMGSLPV